MLLMNYINQAEIESSLGTERSKPIVDAFNKIAQEMKENKNVLDNQEAIIHEIKDSFEEYKNGDLDRKIEIKKDLLIELATKADIATLNGKIDSLKNATKADIATLNGKIDSLEQKMNGKFDSLKNATKAELEIMNGKIGILKQEMHGEFKSIKLWMKMLLALALLSIACFSPTAQVLIKLLKF